VWVLEWAIVVEYFLGEYYRTFIVFPIRIPLILTLSILYWCYLWGMSGWRRAQFGRFTRGDRKLWAKGYTAFWVAEFVTIAAFILLYFWMSWGPVAVVNRMVLFPRKGLLLEFIIYSYLIFLAYIAKLSIKWNLYNFQYVLALVIVAIFSLLLWRDVCMLLTRDPMVGNLGTHWRNVTLGSLVFTLSNEWWLQHALGSKHPYLLYPDIMTVLSMKSPEVNKPLILNTYMMTHRVVRHSYNYHTGYSWTLPYGKLGVDPLLDIMRKHSMFYPVRVGFVPKRLAMWQLLTVLKMWHHLIILLWWMLYLFRLGARKRNSYSFLSVCYFNVYCCYLLGLLIYCIYYAAAWEVYMRVRPTNFSLHRYNVLFESSLQYIVRGFLCGRSVRGHSELLGVAADV
jgi:hypothetical protein